MESIKVPENFLPEFTHGKMIWAISQVLRDEALAHIKNAQYAV